MRKAMAVRWSIKDEKDFRINIRKPLKGSRREKKKYSFLMNVKWTITQRSYCSGVALPSCFLSASFSPCSEHSAGNEFPFPQLQSLVEKTRQSLFLPWCSHWITLCIHHKWIVKKNMEEKRKRTFWQVKNSIRYLLMLSRKYSDSKRASKAMKYCQCHSVTPEDVT